MACACKVNTHINNINKKYGSTQTVKTDIKGKIRVGMYKLFIGLICLPIFPLMLIYLIFRKFITNKPISITRFIKQKRNVRS